MPTIRLPAAFVLLLAACQTPASPPSWQVQLERRLPLLGHRNFVVIADSAYPWQSKPGIETIYTDGDQLAVLDHVLRRIGAAPHVQPKIILDAELTAVPEPAAPGIGAYRTALDEALKGLPVERLTHLNIIEKLDAAANLFQVLVLKTDMVLPYTSVFIELDCGYWDARREQQLRQTLAR